MRLRLEGLVVFSLGTKDTNLNLNLKVHIMMITARSAFRSGPSIRALGFKFPRRRTLLIVNIILLANCSTLRTDSEGALRKAPIPTGAQARRSTNVSSGNSRQATATFSPRSVPMNVVTSSTKRTTIWRRECIVEHSVKR